MWKCALVVVVLGVVAAADADRKIEVKGKLRTGIVAVGGQTTGIVVQTREGSYELDFGKDKDLRARAEKLDKKEVQVTGTLTIKKALEGQKDRKIIRVTKLEEAAGK